MVLVGSVTGPEMAQITKMDGRLCSLRLRMAFSPKETLRVSKIFLLVIFL
jgi:hypothetical protein